MSALSLWLATFFAPITMAASRGAHVVVSLGEPAASPKESPRGQRSALDLAVGMALVLALSALALWAIHEERRWGAYAAHLFGGGHWRWAYLPLGGLLGWTVHRALAERPGGQRPLHRSAREALQPYGQKWTLAAMLFVNFAEEFVWRGFFTKAFVDAGGAPMAGLAVSSLAYGSYHYAFGMRMCMLHTGLGLLYGLLFLAARDLTLPYAAHFAFNLRVWRSIRSLLAR